MIKRILISLLIATFVFAQADIDPAFEEEAPT